MKAKILISITQVILNLQFLIPISGTKGSKEQASPCSSEEFFHHFNKRKAAVNSNTEGYNRLLKSPVEEVRPVKTCSHSLIKQASNNSETKSCQTVPGDQEKTFPERNKIDENMKVPDLTQVKDMAPDITQVTVQSVIENENQFCDNLPKVGSYSVNGVNGVNGVSKEHNSSKSNGSRSHNKESGDQLYRQLSNTRSKSHTRAVNHLNNSYTDPYLDQSCYHQPSVNYYANSIYLGQDIPVFVPSNNKQLYNNLYAIQSSTNQPSYLDYYYNTRHHNQDSDIAYHGMIKYIHHRILEYTSISTFGVKGGILTLLGTY